MRSFVVRALNLQILALLLSGESFRLHQSNVDVDLDVAWDALVVVAQLGGVAWLFFMCLSGLRC